MPTAKTRWLPMGLFVAMLCACANAQRGRAYPNDFYGRPDLTIPASTQSDMPTAGDGVTGVWEGSSTSACWFVSTNDTERCAATQNIRLTMIQQGDQVTGRYKCAYGNRTCRNMDEDGVIRNGSMNGRRLWMRVMLEDGSMCTFTGFPQADLLEGGYSCYQGGGMVEQGVFRTERSY